MPNEKQAIELLTGNLRTPKCRLSYVFVFEPNQKSKTKDGKPKYQCSALIPPGCDLTVLKAAAEACAKEKWGDSLKDKNGNAIKPKSPFLDAGEKMGGDFAGWTLIRLSSVQRPGLINPDGKTQPEPQDVYSGRWAYISCNPGSYDVDGNKGVSFFLNNIQLLDHDEPLSGRPRPESEFAAVEGAGTKTAASVFDD